MTSNSLSKQLLLNQSRVTFSSAGIDSVAYSNTVSTPLVGPILKLVKSAEHTQVTLGQTITYSLTLHNTGNKDALVTLYDRLPEGTAFISNSVLRDGVPLPGTHPSAGIQLGIVSVQTLVRIVFQVILIALPKDLQLVNQGLADFSFQTDEGRKVTGSVSSNSFILQVQGVKVTAHLKANTEQTFIGDTVTYSISVMNQGSQTIHDAVATFRVLEGAVFVPGSVMVNEVYMPSSNPNLGIPAGSIARDTSINISFRVQITQVPADSQFTNQAFIRYQADHSYQEVDSNFVTINVIQPAISLSKQVNWLRATHGDKLFYELVVTNDAAIAVDAVLVDVLPKGVLFIWDSMQLNGQSFNGGRPEEIRLGTLRAYTQTTISFQVNVTTLVGELTTAELVNQAKVYYTFRLPDGRLVQETIMSNTVSTGLFSPIIQLNVDVRPDVIEPDETVEFVLELTNSGNWTADVILTDLVPMEATLLNVSIQIQGMPAASLFAGGLLYVGNIIPKARINITYLARISGYMEVSRIRGHAVAQYRFDLDGRTYRSEVRSNSYLIIVEDPDE
ncbi:DUF11 domain-containing protein [Paenibacillus radicis (ex Xue et al. 2023)]|uniref:DUF11 domain-containing protein n=1 Tax=Paenibacillus radicis (ex Xue et al. 2023) TaxID=2972489 RepID=A0ABT1YCW1_9BACL|nr:DUF11 domain-containing protein [Paenibacillus radicis (ex Xue et al. 2023)]MCR8630254.1 DUF11 domain-containing protein [Paenibacillus radicis (ex Xue et al. 2023)]